MNKYILNPQTGRIVLQSGRIGKQILNTFALDEIENLKRLTIEKQNRRLVLQKCDYGMIWSSVDSNCIDRKTDYGKKIVKCQKDKISTVLREFKENKLIDNNKRLVRNKKQALAIALREENKIC